jgi:RNA polymerase sigma-70 factor (ECF subfamily)
MEQHDTTIALCLQGDEQAWETLVDRLWPVVAGTVWKCLGGARDANAIDDICQDVFAKLCVDGFRALRRFDPARGSLERYVAVMARSTAIDAVRGKGKAQHVAISGFLEESLPAPGGDTPFIEDWELAAALGTLTEREREVVERLYRRELSTGEAAAELGMAEATVRVHKMSGLEKMRKFFGIA